VTLQKVKAAEAKCVCGHEAVYHSNVGGWYNGSCGKALMCYREGFVPQPVKCPCKEFVRLNEDN